MTDVRVARLLVDNSQAAQAFADVTTLMGNMGAAVETQSKRLSGLTREFHTAARAAGVATNAHDRLASVSFDAARAVADGSITAAEAAKVMMALGQRVGLTAEGVLAYTTAVQAGAAQVKAGTLSQKDYLESLRQTLKAQKEAAESQQVAAQAAAQAATAAQARAKALDGLRGKLDEGHAAERRYAEAQQTVIDSFIAGEINARQFSAVMGKVADSLSPAAIAARKAADENARLADGYAQIMAAVDPAAAAQLRFTRALEAVRAGAAAAGKSAGELAADEAALTAALSPAAVAAKKAADENARLADGYAQTMAAVDPAAAAQLRFTKALETVRAGAAAAGKSAEALAADEKLLAAAMDPAVLAAKKEEESLRTLIAGLDRGYFASERLAKGQGLLDRALREGVNGIKLNETEHAKLSQVLRDQYEIATRGATGTKLAAHEMTNLSYQIQDVFVSLAGGQNPLLVLIQQGPQATSAVGGVSRALALLATPAGLATMAVLSVVGAVVALVAAQESYRTSINAVNDANRIFGDATGYTRGQLEAMAGAIRGVSTRDARTMEAAFIRAGTIVGDQFRTAMELARDFARVTGQDTTQAAQTLADVLKDPAKGAETLRDSYRALTAAQAEYMQRLAAQGETAKAQQVGLDALKTKYRDFADEGVGYLGRMMHWAKTQSSDLWDSLGRVGAPKSLTQQLADADAYLAKVEARFKKTMGRAPTSTELAQLEPEAWNDRETLRGKEAAEDAVAAARAESAALEDRRRAGIAASKQINEELGQQTALSDQYEVLRKAAEGYASQVADLTKGEGRASSALASVREAYAQVAEAMGRVTNARATYLTMVQRLAEQDRIALDYAGKYGQQADRDRAREQARLETAGQKLTDKEREAKVNSAVTQVIASQTAAVTGQTAALDGATAALDGLTAAYGRGAAAIRDAELQQKAAQATLGMVPELRDKVAASIVRQELAQRRLNQAQADYDLQNQIADAERLARAEAVSDAAVGEANVQNRIRAQILREGVELDSQRARAIEAGTRALEAQNAVAKVNAAIRGQNTDLELARAEFQMLGLTNAERERGMAILRATVAVQNDPAWQQVPRETRDAWVSQAGAVAEYQSRIQNAKAAAADFAGSLTKGLEDVLVAGGKADDVLKELQTTLKRGFFRELTRPLNEVLTGTFTKLLAPTRPDSLVQPVTSSDPGGWKALFGELSAKAGLGSAPESALWVKVAAASGGLTSASPGGGAGGLGTLALPVSVSVADGGDIVQILRSEARAQGVPEEVALAVGRIESNLSQYNSHGRVLTSSAGAQGIMQLMPGTASWLGVDAANTQDNIRGGVKFLAMLGRQFGGDWNLAAAAYNAGPGTVQAWQRRDRASLPAETVTYLQRFGPATEAARQQIAQAGASTRQFASAVTQTGTRFAVVEQAAGGVTTAMESQVAAQMDAVSAANREVAANQEMTAAQLSGIRSVLGLSDHAEAAGAAVAANAAAVTDATGVINVLPRAMDKLHDNAISAAEAQGAAADGAGFLAETFAGVSSGLSQAVNSLWSWLSGLFASGPGGGAAGPATLANGAAGSSSLTNAAMSKASGWALDKMGVGGKLTSAIDSWGYSTLGIGSVGGWATAAPATVTAATAAPITGAASINAATGVAAAGNTAAANALYTGSASGVSGAAGVTGGMSAYLGAAGAGAFGGGLLGGWAGTAAQSKAVGAGVGAAAGAGSAYLASIIGMSSIGGPIGLAIGAVVGAIMGALGTSKTPAGPGAAIDYVYNSDGTTSYQTYTRKGETDEKVTAIGQTTASTLDLLRQVGGSLTGAVSFHYGYNQRDGVDTVLNGRDFTTSDDPDYFVRALIKQLRDEGSLTFRDDAALTQRALDHALGDSANSLEDIVSVVALAQAITDATTGLSDLDKSLRGVTAAAQSSAAAQYKTVAAELEVAKKGGIESEYRSLIERQIRASWETAVEAVTPLQAALAGIDGSFAALTDAVGTLGLSISDAEVEAARLAQREKVLTDYRKSYDAALHQAQGRDYLTQVQGVRDYWTANAADMLAAGRNPNDIYAAQLSSAINGLDVKALDDIIGFFRELDPVAASFAEARKAQIQATERAAVSLRLLEAQVSGGAAAQAAYDAEKRRIDRDAELAAATDEVTKSLLAQVYAAQDLATAAQKAAEIQAASADLQERAMTNVGRLFAANRSKMQRQFAEELTAEQARGGGNLDLLRLTQAAELASSDVSTIGQMIDSQISAIEAQTATTRQSVEAMRNLSRSLLDAADEAALSKDVSPLSSQERQNLAQSLWQEAAAAAKSNPTDADAISRLISAGKSYMEVTRDETSSSRGSSSAYHEVTGLWKSLGVNGSATLDAQQQLVDAADKQIAELQKLKELSSAALASQQALPVTVDTLRTSLVAAVDRLAAATAALDSGVTGNAQSGNARLFSAVQAIVGNSLYSAGTDSAGQNLAAIHGGGLTLGEVEGLARLSGYQGEFGNGRLAAYHAANPEAQALFLNLQDYARTLVPLDRLRQYQAGGIVGAFEAGGVVGNGVWNQDSVLARYSGGGNIMLAGGEYVMPAAAAAANLPVLNAMRAGAWKPANDHWPAATNSNDSIPNVALPPPPRIERGAGDGSAPIVSEIRRFRDDVTREIRQQTSATVEMMQRQIDAQAAEIAALRRRIDKQSSEIRLSNDKPQFAKTKAKGAA